MDKIVVEEDKYKIEVVDDRGKKYVKITPKNKVDIILSEEEAYNFYHDVWKGIVKL